MAFAEISEENIKDYLSTKAITGIDESGIDTRHIMRVSGHKSDTSIKHFNEA